MAGSTLPGVGTRRHSTTTTERAGATAQAVELATDACVVAAVT